MLRHIARTAHTAPHENSLPVAALGREPYIKVGGSLAGCSRVRCLLPTSLAAQQNATVQGTVVDESQGVMPGATVTATEISTGRQSVAVTTEEGRYRFDNLAPGRYKLRMELSGFATAEIADIELLVGANATVPPIAMKLADAAGDDYGDLAGAARQHDLVAGVREHRSPPDGGAAAAGPELDGAGDDGQRRHGQQPHQHARRVGRPVSAQPRWPTDHAARGRLGVRPAQSQPGGDRRVPDRDEHVRHHAGPFDRDAGAGDLALGHQRSARLDLRILPQRHFNAADPVTGTVLPFQNQQAGVTMGGPIIQNKMHFFGSYEHERQPADVVPGADAAARTRPSSSRRSRPTTTIWAGSTINNRPRTASRSAGSVGRFNNPFSISSGTAHPSTADKLQSYSTNVVGTWTHVASSNLMMQFQGGLNRFSWYNDAQPEMDVPFHSTPFFVPGVRFPRLDDRRRIELPERHVAEHLHRAGSDVNWHLGKHETKFGGEFLRVHDTKVWSLNRRGTYTFSTTALGRRAGAPLPGQRLERPGRPGTSAASSRICRTSRSISTRTT